MICSRVSVPVASIKKVHMKKALVLTAVSVVSSACSARPYTGEQVVTTSSPSGLVTTETESRSILPGGILAGRESELQEISATVVALDLKSRQITLETADTKQVSFRAGEEIRNLNQVKIGDVVKLTYFESIDFEVRPPTAAEIERASTEAAVGVLGRAPKGARPGMAAGVGAIAILSVDSVDKKRETVTVKGAGSVMTVRAKHPENLALIKAGDTIVVTVSELLIANVQPLS